jgi:hypothetical protein
MALTSRSEGALWLTRCDNLLVKIFLLAKSEPVLSKLALDGEGALESRVLLFYGVKPLTLIYGWVLPKAEFYLIFAESKTSY